MQDSDKQRKNRPTLMEGCHDVLNLLKEARQVVDEVTQTAKTQRGHAKPGSRGRTQAALPKKFAYETGGQEMPPSASFSPEAARTVVTPAAPDALKGQPRDLAYYRISVKHAIAGRIRLHIPKMSYDKTLAERLPALLTTVPGVLSAEANTASGSLLITYDPHKLGEAKGRRELAAVLHQFFPKLDTETLVKRMQSA